MWDIFKDFITLYGPLGIGWVAFALIWRQYQRIIDAYHCAIVENTKVTERLALLIEERTRQRHAGNN